MSELTVPAAVTGLATRLRPAAAAEWQIMAGRSLRLTRRKLAGALFRRHAR